MSVVKIIEINAGSKKGFEDAIQKGIAKASTTVNDIQGAWIKEQKVVVNKGEIAEYRVDMKVSFLVGKQ